MYFVEGRITEAQPFLELSLQKIVVSVLAQQFQ
jgi:hypothetical protein